MKIYTKKGDGGKTLGPKGQEVFKNDLSIELFGSIDKAQVTIGILYETLKKDTNKYPFDKLLILKNLEMILPYFYQISSSIYLNKNMVIKDFDLKIESWIDELDKLLPPLKNFILPIGSLSSSYAHMGRVNVRSLERKFIAWDLNNNFSEIRKFLNRLSDYFFNLARILSLDEKLSKKA
ncbi:MAG: ATP:cob(I)alamin adenosyltransferase [Acholeplasmataceae bacterium]